MTIRQKKDIDGLPILVCTLCRRPPELSQIAHLPQEEQERQRQRILFDQQFRPGYEYGSPILVKQQTEWWDEHYRIVKIAWSVASLKWYQAGMENGLPAFDRVTGKCGYCKRRFELRLSLPSARPNVALYAGLLGGFTKPTGDLITGYARFANGEPVPQVEIVTEHLSKVESRDVRFEVYNATTPSKAKLYEKAIEKHYSENPDKPRVEVHSFPQFPSECEREPNRAVVCTQTIAADPEFPGVLFTYFLSWPFLSKP